MPIIKLLLLYFSSFAYFDALFLDKSSSCQQIERKARWNGQKDRPQLLAPTFYRNWKSTDGSVSLMKEVIFLKAYMQSMCETTCALWYAHVSTNFQRQQPKNKNKQEKRHIKPPPKKRCTHTIKNEFKLQLFTEMKNDLLNGFNPFSPVNLLDGLCRHWWNVHTLCFSCSLCHSFTHCLFTPFTIPQEFHVWYVSMDSKVNVTFDK